MEAVCLDKIQFKLENVSKKFSHTHTQWLPKADVTVSILRILGPILGAVLNFKLTYEVRSANMNSTNYLYEVAK